MFDLYYINSKTPKRGLQPQKDEIYTKFAQHCTKDEAEQALHGEKTIDNTKASCE